jgi:hypothetical protein
LHEKNRMSAIGKTIRNFHFILLILSILFIVFFVVFYWF